MKLYFIDKSDCIFIICLCFLICFFLHLIGFIISLFVVIVFILLRVRKLFQCNNSSSYFAPISGKVIDVSKGFKDTQILVKMNYFGDWGVYSPCNFRVMSFGVTERKRNSSSYRTLMERIKNVLLRKKSSVVSTDHTSDVLTLESGYNYTHLNFIQTHVSFFDLFLNIDIGDNLGATSLIGFKLAGGKVLIKVPPFVDVSLISGDRIIGGRTVIGLLT